MLRLFDLTAACTGASEKTLRHAGIPFDVIHLHPDSHAGYPPGASPIALKLLFAPDTGKLLGAQAVGGEGVDKRIDVLTTALQAGMSVHDLAELELAYAPPLGAAKDPVNLAGMIAQNILAGDINVIQWHEIADLAPHERVILDVRDGAERQQGYIPGSVHIPLPQLRSRLSELPRDGEIIPYCWSGQRSYDACRILSQHGFRVRNLTGSYRTWPMATIRRNMGHCSDLAEPPPGLARRMRPSVSCRGLIEAGWPERMDVGHLERRPQHQAPWRDRSRRTPCGTLSDLELSRDREVWKGGTMSLRRQSDLAGDPRTSGC